MPPTNISQDQTRSFYGSLQAVRTVTDVNVSLTGLQSINGVTGADGLRILVVAQTAAVDNGVYIMRAGAWERSADAETGLDLGTMLVLVAEGSFGNEMWHCTNFVDNGVIDTHALTFAPYSKGDPDGFFETTVFIWNINGNVQLGAEQDGIRAPLGQGIIERLAIYMADIGGDGDTVVDIKKHQIVDPPMDPGETQYDRVGVSIYNVNPANRPTIAGDNANKTINGVHRALLPDTIDFDAGSFFTVDLVSNTNAARDLSVLMMVRYA